MSYCYNLVIVHTPRLQSLSDFLTIRSLIAEKSPEIEVFIVGHAELSILSAKLPDRPTVVFSPTPIGRVSPLHTELYAGQRLSKYEQFVGLAAGGVSVSDTVMLEPYTALEPQSWGAFTVLKPDFGHYGRGVSLVRTRDVSWVDPMSLPMSDHRYRRRLVAPKSVDTGPFSKSYRVMTVFGRAVYCTVS